MPLPKTAEKGAAPGTAQQKQAVYPVHKGGNDSQRRPRSNAFAFQRLVPAFQLAIRLRVARRGSDVRHARDANELLEIAGNELRAVVRDEKCNRLKGRVVHHRETGLQSRASGGAHRKPTSSVAD